MATWLPGYVGVARRSAWSALDTPPSNWTPVPTLGAMLQGRWVFPRPVEWGKDRSKRRGIWHHLAKLQKPLGQGLLSSGTVAFWTGYLLAEAAVLCIVESEVAYSWPLLTTCQEPSLPRWDSQKCPQMLLHVPWGAKWSPLWPTPMRVLPLSFAPAERALCRVPWLEEALSSELSSSWLLFQNQCTKRPDSWETLLPCLEKTISSEREAVKPRGLSQLFCYWPWPAWKEWPEVGAAQVDELKRKLSAISVSVGGKCSRLWCNKEFSKGLCKQHCVEARGTAGRGPEHRLLLSWVSGSRETWSLLLNATNFLRRDIYLS